MKFKNNKEVNWRNNKKLVDRLEAEIQHIYKYFVCNNQSLSIASPTWPLGQCNLPLFKHVYILCHLIQFAKFYESRLSTMCDKFKRIISHYEFKGAKCTSWLFVRIFFSFLFSLSLSVSHDKFTNIFLVSKYMILLLQTVLILISCQSRIVQLSKFLAVEMEHKHFIFDHFDEMTAISLTFTIGLSHPPDECIFFPFIYTQKYENKCFQFYSKLGHCIYVWFFFFNETITFNHFSGNLIRLKIHLDLVFDCNQA